MSHQCRKCNNEYTDEAFRWCRSCQINSLKKYPTISDNEKINNFIREMQLKIDSHFDIVFEWIPYSQFNCIKQIGSYRHITVYSARWYNGPLYYDNDKAGYTRYQFRRNQNVTLKSLRNLQIVTDEFLNKVKTYSIKRQDAIRQIYGISQNPDTKDYIMVLEDGKDNYCERCDKKHNRKCRDINITVYSATWKNHPLYYYNKKIESTGHQFCRNSNVTLKCLHNPQININEFLNKVKTYSIKQVDTRKIYGITQNPGTKDHIMVLDKISEDGYITAVYSATWKNSPLYYNYDKTEYTRYYQNYNVTLKGLHNSRINEFINKAKTYSIKRQDDIQMQLKTDYCNGIIIEWIPYSQFNVTKDNHAKVYSAVWKDGPLYYYDDIMGWTNKRSANTNVILRQLHRLQDIGNEFLSEYNTLYGISQDPDTKNYIIIQDEYCKNCGEKYIDVIHGLYNPCKMDHLKKNFINWTSENKTIDDFIKKAQLNNNYFNNTFEWIPYDQFDDIEEIGKGGFATVYSAIWKNGPLYYDNKKKKWLRNYGVNKKVALKCLHDSQNFTDKFLHEAKVHSTKISIYILDIYGISQNPDSKDYIMVLDYVESGDLGKWMTKNYDKFDWSYKLLFLWNTVRGLKEIHQKKMVHRDLHPGNILVKNEYWPYISDMGLCGNVDDIATGKQPFYDSAHDFNLAISICKGVRPVINDLEAPKYYIDLMKRCWDSNPDNRLDINEIFDLTKLFSNSKQQQNTEIGKQLKVAEESRKVNSLSIDVIQSKTHPQAIYTSRIFKEDLSKYNNINNNSVEVTDFTE
ncbi:kinase-like domain-containing protein [Rhizophagus clarus]|uniref:Kinase-like domain-containing protein n=1 Tax=Rhizophagus clarus TaxID=94130 RepID=A0A8H3QEJ8_9GLOM|nr:kinase-like domain-containing protein [Rhizophagus clarus]